MRSTAAVVVVLTGLVGAVVGSASLQQLLDDHPIRSARTTREGHWGVNLTTTELIEALGYPAEIHHVVTEDGYILEIHRIPYGKSGPSENRPVAYLQHGILSSSADWIMNTPDEALGFILADAGYDVWLSNLRGNTYSRNHSNLDPAHVSFWNFNWDEMAKYDTPTCIDFVLSHTGADDLYYIGFSMGTTTFFAMMSDRPEYNDKVRVMVGLAPVAYMEHAKGPITELAPISDDIDLVLTLLGVGELLPSGPLMDYLADNYCDPALNSSRICANILFLIAGFDPAELNEEYLPVLLSHTPAGASVHTLNHYGQLIMSANFAKYDYGLLGNLNHYGQNKPPLYDLNRVTTPVGLFWADNDWLAPPENVAKLEAELPNVALSYKVDFAEFNHLDFVWAIHANELVYKHVLEFLAGYRD